MAKRSKRTVAEGKRGPTGASAVDFPTRWPSPEHRQDIAAVLELSPAQADKLWQSVDRMCRRFERYRAVTPLPGEERAAMLHQLRRLCAQLSEICRWVADAPPHAAHAVRGLLGPVLAEQLSEVGFWAPTGSFPVDRCSIHHLDLLECERDPETDACAGVERISASNFLRQVEAYQLERRQNAGEESAIVLRGLTRALNSPIVEYLEVARRQTGGPTGQPYRNAVIRRLAETYREITGKKPTTAPGGAFALWCDCILDALGMRTEGLEGAIQRQLAPRRR